MSIVDPNGDKCLELGLLASVGLLLHEQNLQNLILEGYPQKKSMISDSFMGKEKKYISSKDLIFLSLTRWPSLVKGLHSLSLALPLLAL